jgi:hypothetical protein
MAQALVKLIGRRGSDERLVEADSVIEAAALASARVALFWWWDRPDAIVEHNGKRYRVTQERIQRYLESVVLGANEARIIPQALALER